MESISANNSSGICSIAFTVEGAAVMKAAYQRLVLHASMEDEEESIDYFERNIADWPDNIPRTALTSFPEKVVETLVIFSETTHEDVDDIMQIAAFAYDSEIAADEELLSRVAERYRLGSMAVIIAGAIVAGIS